MTSQKSPNFHPGLTPPAAHPEPDLRVSIEQDGLTVAHAGLWVNGPTFEGEPCGLIGQYAALDAESGKAVLGEACRLLAARGVPRVLGPVDGSTWFRYRLVTEPGTEPSFLLEPFTPPAYVEHWRSAGFAPVLHYASGLCAEYLPSEKALRLADRFEPMIETASPEHTEQTLADLHRLSLEAFAPNPLYTPLPRPAFDLLYRPLLGKIPLDWVWLAKDQNQTVGFGFAYPDPHHQALVIKTIAALPGRKYAGLGRYLGERYHARAFGSGFKKVIHALMHEGNASTSLSGRYGGVMRRYAVFGRALTVKS